jgi:hypothetical protein
MKLTLMSKEIENIRGHTIFTFDKKLNQLLEELNKE